MLDPQLIDGVKNLKAFLLGGKSSHNDAASILGITHTLHKLALLQAVDGVVTECGRRYFYPGA